MKPPENASELVEILPEIEEIEDFDLRNEVIDVFLQHAPDYFWTTNASNTYHQKDVRGEAGLVIHTKRSFTVLDTLSDTFVKLDRVTEQEVEYAKAAVLLHDLFKKGVPPEKDSSVSNHDIIAAEYLEENTNLPEEIINCVHTHNGGWYDGGSPETDLELMHHLADMIGSGKDIYSCVLDPTDELEEKIIDQYPKSVHK